MSNLSILNILDKKRQGESHSREEIFFLANGMMDGSITDYQVSAWLMAVCIKGLNIDETTWLTDAFVQSGDILDCSGIDGVVVDKHSTGGVGDKTTLVLIPLLAVAGVKVAKLSGRGLGFTGGTIDKLEAIPNFKVALDNDTFLKQINQIGVAISSQTGDLAPADGKMYALRDVTSTVASIPLIAASVVSKKIAAGAQVIVLDIKYGRGAFMKQPDDAKALAETCREVGKRLGRNITTVISAMEEPLGRSIGHTLEVQEALDTLKNKGPEDLEELCLTLGSVALTGAGIASTIDEARQQLKSHLEDGSALKKFEKLIDAQSGNSKVTNDYSLMPQAKNTIEVKAEEDGFIKDIDALKIAQGAKVLGAGRITKADPLDLAVGVVVHHKVAESIKAGDVIATIYANTKGTQEAIESVKDAFTFSDAPVTEPTLILEVQG